MTTQRRLTARKIREDAAALAEGRNHPQHQANGDEQRYSSAHYPLNFTKGLHHNEATGLVDDPRDFEAFRSAIDSGFVDTFTSRVPVPRKKERRKWEAPTAGLVYDLQGPDAQAVTMAPAPPVCSDELTFEMAEVYELALLRDKDLNSFTKGAGSAAVQGAVGRLNKLNYAVHGFNGRPRKTGENSKLDSQTVFRGSSPGVEKGPYLSQFMLIGTGNPEDGFIDYGAQRIDQRVNEAENYDDYMMDWQDWLHVQEGYEVRNTDKCGSTGPGQKFTGKRRFIYTPRDLATYVHVDQLYQAYLNACLILLNNGTPFDPGFDYLSGGADSMLHDPVTGDKAKLNAGGFALWGGPHILSLVTEVATRGLKAVRYQKFNNHLRLRPEALAARLFKAEDIELRYPALCTCFSRMALQLTEVLYKVCEHNKNYSKGNESSALLPMAFEEGSPMHPAYGAGHATVAGACVTILKAFFDTSAVFVKINDVAGFYGKAKIAEALGKGCKVEAGAYTVIEHGKKLHFETCGAYKMKKKAGGAMPIFKGEQKSKDETCCPLTLEGELNKLAANISIGRNMAGVHFFSDYYDSLRMGEKVAIGMLEEQALCYATDPCVMSLPTFDGQVVRIGSR